MIFVHADEVTVEEPMAVALSAIPFGTTSGPVLDCPDVSRLRLRSSLMVKNVQPGERASVGVGLEDGLAEGDVPQLLVDQHLHDAPLLLLGGSA